MYGSTTHGIAPASVHKMRRMALGVTAMPTRGACITTSLHLCLGVERDPAIQYPLEIIWQWLQLLYDKAFDTRRYARCWMNTLGMFCGSANWLKVTGPVSATIATLLEAGWKPDAHDCWTYPGGDAWALQPTQDGLTRAMAAPVLAAFRTTLENQL